MSKFEIREDLHQVDLHQANLHQVDLGGFVPGRIQKEQRYVITGVNVLTGEREELSRPMSQEEAQARLDRENESRKRQRYQAHKRLRVELRLPVQLTLNFSAYG